MSHQTSTDRGDSGLDTAAVRSEEALDMDKLLPWLKTAIPVLQNQTHPPSRVTQYTGDASNWTYRLQFAQTDLILRRPPSGSKA